MYNPPAFREDRPDVLREAIRSHPLGTLITHGESGLLANVVPFTLRTDDDGDVLCAHLAKANGQIAHFRQGGEALVVFQGPQAYISPSWYATKREHGRVVPTWNYIVVQARGTPRVFDDPAWLLQQLDALTDAHESKREASWAVIDAPADFVAAQLKGITGFELPIAAVEGKWKVSQNQPERNRAGVVAGLGNEGAEAMARAVSERLPG